jgi:hypothetical protein
MGTTSRTTVDLRIVGHRLPGRRWSGYQAIHVGMQRRPGEVVGLVPGDADEAVFDLPLDVVTDERAWTSAGRSYRAGAASGSST